MEDSDKALDMGSDDGSESMQVDPPSEASPSRGAPHPHSLPVSTAVAAGHGTTTSGDSGQQQQHRHHRRQIIDTDNDTTPAATPPPGSASHPAPADATELNELEAYLQQPDAIMEPDIIHRLSEYLRASGNPRHAVEFLAESYVGYSQMATLVCSWLQAVDEEKHEEAAAAGVTSSGARKQDRHYQGEYQRKPLDESHYLGELVLEKFDPGKFSGIFLAGGGGVPKWLNPLIAEPDGRSLIYDLSATYSNCLLLNFAIQKILMQPGREAEVAAVGTSLVGYFGVFHRLMNAKLREIVAATTEAELQRLSSEFSDICCQSQHAFVHALLVLKTLAKQDSGIRFLRVAEELEAAAASKHGSVVYKMRRWFLPTSRNSTATSSEPLPLDEELDVVAAAAGVLGDMLASAVVAGGAAPTPDVIKLYRLYFPPGNSKDAAVPPAVLLRHPAVFQSLLQGLFNPGRSLQAEATIAHIGLLAVAAAGLDDESEITQQQQQQQQDSLKGDSEQLPVEVGSSRWADQPAVCSTFTALQAVVSAAHKACKDEAIPPEDLMKAENAMSQPICAAGVLRMMRSQLGASDAWASSFRSHTKASPLVLLLAAAAKIQPAMSTESMAIVKEALSTSGSVGHASSQSLLEVAAILLVQGQVVQVLDWAQEWASNADPGLVRYLFFQILARVAPPYSPVFGCSMLKLLGQSGFRKARLASRDWSIGVPLLAEFLRGCSVVQGMTLGQKELLVLKELESSEMLQKELALRDLSP